MTEWKRVWSYMGKTRRAAKSKKFLKRVAHRAARRLRLDASPKEYKVLLDAWEVS
jgi:hypothetical protein